MDIEFSYTDVDAIFEPEVVSDANLKYKRHCAKPKGFNGVGKYRVSCLEFINSRVEPYPSGRNALPMQIFHSFGWYGYSVIEGTEQTLIILNRPQSEIPDCEREIYMIVKNTMNLQKPKKGDKIYFVDPREMICSSKAKGA